VSASATASDGHQNNAPFGLKPKGILIYTREGTMSAVISHDGRKPLSVADRISAPLEERAEAFTTFFAYAGRYTDSGEKVIHHVEVSSVQNWVNTDLIRLVRKEGARIILTTPPTSAGGTKQRFELVWERVELAK
jgi:Lipocalin-like domain